mgnify:FL=1
MTNQTAKRGRPRKTEPQAAQEVATKTKAQSVREKAVQDYYEKTPRHYESINYKGVVYMLKSSDVSVFDKDRGGVVTLRYCAGENSPYKDDQSTASTATPVVFKNGNLFVRPDQPNLAKFLDKHPGNEANGGNKFRLIDNRKKAKDIINKEFEVVDALVLIRTKPTDDILSVATSLGYNTDRLMDEIKHDLTVYAKKNPKVFIEMFDDPATKVKSHVKQALSFGIISDKGGYVRWTDTNNHIIAVPEGKDSMDVFTRYCLTEAGAPVYEEIKRQL